MKKLVLPPKHCLHCGELFYRGEKQRASDFKEKKYCTKKCYHEFAVGVNSPAYVRGYRKRPDGYLRDSNDQYLHRLVMEKHLGRKLKPSEHVHHINENPSDNRISNLYLTTNSKHRKIHAKSAKRDTKGRWAKSSSSNNRN